ncbi:MAG: antitoxin Xre/MbcA/ParS toxin-binding domain-containing protein [Pseudomonadota bacterium]
MSVTPKEIATVMGGSRVLKKRVQTHGDLRKVVIKGVPKKALDKVVSRIAVRDSRNGRLIATKTSGLKWKIVPRPTYQKAGTTLNLQASETVERIARLVAMATSAFEDDDEAARFMNEPHPELGGESPFEVALTEPGGRLVEEVIERGLHGLPA